MRTFYIIAGAMLLVAVVAAFFFSFHSARNDAIGTVVDMRGTSEVRIVLTDKGFEPQQVRITKGTKVMFTTTRHNQFWPASNPHPSHDIYPEFDPKEPINPGLSWTFTFDRAGAWGYHDHVRSYFSGTVYVDE